LLKAFVVSAYRSVIYYKWFLIRRP